MAMMASNSNSYAYNYEPLGLNQIRLLSISRNNGEMVGKLTKVNLTSPPKYLALSYTWDDQAADQNFCIDGAWLKVIQNITILLPYLLEKYPGQYFWIDGICINQGRKAEKDIQVPLMRTIYPKAASCVIWLGESSPLMDLAIPMIPELLARSQGYDPSLGLNNQALAARGLPDLSSPIWEGLEELFGRDWFCRVWTFQEAVLARVLEVWCGRHYIDTTHLVQLASSLTSVSESGSQQEISNAVSGSKLRAQAGIERILTISNARHQMHSLAVPTYTFLDLLSRSMYWKASNPLDKIYGLLGLADKNFQDSLGVHYEFKMPDLYLAFGKCWIERTVYLEMFHMINSSNRTPGVPSWCPTFVPQQATSFGPQANVAQYRAGFRYGNRVSISLVADSAAISVEGFQIDEVAEVLLCPWERQVYGNPQAKSYGIARLLEWEMKCLELSRRVYNTSPGLSQGGSVVSQIAGNYLSQRGGFFPQILRAAQQASQNFSSGTPDSVPDAHWRTLIANKHANGQRYNGRGREAYHLAKVETRKLTTANLPMLPEEQRLTMRPLTEYELKLAQDYGQAFGYGSHGRSFISTRGGRVGLAPPCVQPGDLICIFYNGFTPFIIRPIQDDPFRATYELIGESYVDGLMYGEAFRMRDKKPDAFFVLQ